jgi:acyl dehydratase
MIELDFFTLGDRIGQEIAVSPWLEVTQARIDAFAEATEDRQWIHVDPVKAAAQSPFKATIAHGFLTLALVSVLLRTAMSFTIRMAINYGLNRVRFVSAVPVGSRVRGRFTPGAVEQVEGGLQVTWRITVERAGQEKPAAVVEWIVRYYP